jgi:hypothetical protein
MKSAKMITLTLLLAVLIAGGAWLYTPDKSRPVLEAKYLSASDEYRLVARIRLRVRESGRQDSPVVILLHGFGASLETWEAWAKWLSADYRVVRFDLPGFGLTGPDPTGDYSDRRTLDVLTALMDQLGVERASLVGNSLGGEDRVEVCRRISESAGQTDSDLAGRLRQPRSRVWEEARSPLSGQVATLHSAEGACAFEPGSSIQ